MTPPRSSPLSQHNDLETKVPIRNIQYCIASSKYMTYELVSKTWPEFLHARILDRCRQSRMDGCTCDGRQVSVSLQRNKARDKFLFNLDIYIYVYIFCVMLIIRVSMIKKEIYISNGITITHYTFFFFQVKFQIVCEKNFLSLSFSLRLGFSPLFAVSFTLSRVVGRDKKQRQQRVQQNFTG